MTESRKIVPLKGVGAIEAEAAAWIARLDSGEATRDDIAAFAAWKAQNPQNQEAAQRLVGLWSEMDALGVLASPLAPPPRRRLNFGGAAAFRYAALAAAAVALAIGATVYAPEIFDGTQAYETAVGAQKTVNLADGSSIELNTDTRVEVRYTRGARDLLLTRGEAFFDVAPDKARPFSVYTREGVVRAVGTGFVVRVRDKEMEVTVTKGVVQVSSLSAPVNAVRLADAARLARTPRAMVAATDASGERAVLTEDQLERADVPAPEVTRSQSWRQGMLVFQGDELSAVIDDVSRYTDINIEIVDPEIKALRVGGYFRVGDVEPMLDALEKSFGVRVERVDSKHIRLSAAS